MTRNTIRGHHHYENRHLLDLAEKMRPQVPHLGEEQMLIIVPIRTKLRIPQKMQLQLSNK